MGAFEHLEQLMSQFNIESRDNPAHYGEATTETMENALEEIRNAHRRPGLSDEEADIPTKVPGLCEGNKTFQVFCQKKRGIEQFRAGFVAIDGQVTVRGLVIVVKQLYYPPRALLARDSEAISFTPSEEAISSLVQTVSIMNSERLFERTTCLWRQN